MNNSKLSFIPLVLVLFILFIYFYSFNWNSSTKINEFYNGLNSINKKLNSYSQSTPIQINVDSLDQDISKVLVNLELVTKEHPQDVFFLHYKSLLLERLANISIVNIVKKSLRLSTEEDRYLEIAYKDLKNAEKYIKYDALLFHNLAWLSYLKGNDNDAKFYFNKSIKQNQGNPIFHISLGIVSELTNDTLTAFYEYKKAILLSSEILFSPFFINLEIRNQELAKKIIISLEEELTSQVKKKNDPLLLSRLGVVELKLNKLSTSLDLLNKAKSLLPNLPLTYYYLGVIYNLQQNVPEAKKMFEIAHFISKNEYMPSFYLANIAFIEKKDSTGLIYARTSCERYRNSFIDENRQLSINYHRTTLCDSYLPKGIIYYTKPLLDEKVLANIFFTCYNNIGESKLAFFFQNYLQVYMLNSINEIGNPHFKYLVSLANEYLITSK